MTNTTDLENYIIQTIRDLSKHYSEKDAIEAGAMLAYVDILVELNSDYAEEGSNLADQAYAAHCAYVEMNK